MQKPDDIPEDIWQEALRVMDRINSYDPTLQDIEVVARALLAERETWDALITGLEAENLAKSKDWCDFCEDIGVDVDTHEAVAYQIKCMFDG